MTPTELNRYFELPEEFRYDDLFYSYYSGIWQLGRYETAHEISEEAAELIAIASMLVGLRKAGLAPQLTDDPSGRVFCSLTITKDAHFYSHHSASSNFLALLAACEAVVKNRGEA